MTSLIMKQGEAKTITFTVTDSDSDNINYYYKWFKNGVINSSGNLSSFAEGLEVNINNLSSSAFVKGDNLTFSCLASDSVGNSSWLNSSVLTISNTGPVFDESLINKDLSHIINLVYDVNCSDLDGDTLTYYDNTSLFNINSSTGIIFDNPSLSDVGMHYILINCSDGTTQVTDTFIYNITNNAPTFDESLINKELSHSVNLTYDVNCSDLDGDSLTYYDNSSLFNINSGTGLIEDNPSQGEAGVYNILINCSDGTSQVTDTFIYTITNNAPGMNTSRISPTTAYTNDSLKGFCNTSDSDSDNINYYYKWFKNSVINSSGNLSSFVEGLEVNINNLSSSSFVHFDNLTFSCLANDGTLNSSWLNSSVLTISNSIPSISGLDVLSDSPTTISTLNASWVFSDLDNDSESLSSIKWFVNSVLEQSSNFSFGDSLPSLASSFFVKGDTVKVSVLASDGFSNASSWSNASELIENSLPSFTNVSLSPIPAYKSSVLTCSVNGGFDDDSDGLTNYYKFLDSDLSILQGWGTNQSFSCNSETNCTKDDVITCQGYVSDGTGNSGEKSVNITITNTAPVASSVLIDPSNPLSDDNLSCNYSYSDVDSDLESNTFFRWYNSTALLDVITQNLSSSYTSNGETIFCSVSVFDGTINSSWTNSSSKTINSSGPSISSLLSSGETSVGDNIVFSWNWSDPGLPTGSYIHYLCNSSSINSSGCSDKMVCSVSDNISGSNCSIMVNDSMAHSMTYYLLIVDEVNNTSPVSSLNWLVNHYPISGNASISVAISDPYNIYTCTFDASDEDSDSLTKYYSFFNNDSLLQAESGTNTFITSSGPGVSGGNINCKGRVSDGMVYSDYGRVNNSFLLNNLSISSGYLNEVTIISINVSNSSGITDVNLSLINPYSVSLTGLMTYSNTTNLYSYSFNPNIVGTWSINNIKAYQTDSQSYLLDSSLTFNITAAPGVTPEGGGGGGTRTTTIEQVGNLTGFCGDGICGEGEDPTNCWEDCRINYDTLITCIWDEDIDCNWGQNWFVTFLIIFLFLVLVGGIYLFEVKRKK